MSRRIPYITRGGRDPEDAPSARGTRTGSGISPTRTSPTSGPSRRFIRPRTSSAIEAPRDS
ncbi:MAG: hypothetical protein ACYC24_10240 [Desulfobacteria bacterium]